MPLRGGESVGSAYVRIYADGSEVPGDIRRALEDSEPSVREAGRDHGRTYGEEFDAQVRKSFKTNFGDTKKSMFHDLNEGLTDSLARIELSKRFFDNGPEWKEFLRRMEDEFGKAGRLAARSIEAEFRDSGDLEGITARMRRVGQDVRKAQLEILNSLHAEALRMNKAFNSRVREEAQQVTRSNRQALIQFRNSMREISQEVIKLEKGTSKLSHSMLSQMVNDLRKLAPSLDATPHQIDLFNDRLNVLHKRLIVVNPRIAEFDRGVQRLGHNMGRFFGKGSRNDFLNFFGSVVAMGTQIPRLLTPILTGITNVSRGLKDAFSGGGAGGLFTGLQAAFVGVGSAALKAGAALGGFLIVMVAIAAIVGPITSALSGLLGILVALGSTLVYAVGAAGALLPLIVPIAGIIGGIVAAVMGLKDAGGALGRQMDHIKEQAKGLWSEFKEGITQSKGLGTVLNETSRILATLDPLFDAVIRGFNRFSTAIGDEMAGGNIDKFINRFTRFLPSAMKRLGEIFANTFGGIGGVLRGSIPAANILLDNLVNITDRFDEWANSKEGQRQIKQFLEDAVESADALGGFIEDAWNFFKKLIKEGKDSGDTIWTNMGDAFADATTFFEENPTALQDWFEHAENTATQIGEIIDAVIELADTLDSESSRVEQMYLFKGLTLAVETIAGQFLLLNDIARVTGEIVGIIALGFETMGKIAWYIIGGKWVGALFDGIEAAVKGAGDVLSGIFKDLFGGGKGGGAMAITPKLDLSGISGAIAKLPGMISRAVTSIVRGFQGLAGRIAGAAGDIVGRIMTKVSPIPGRVATTVVQLIAKFGNVAERIARALGDVWGQISDKFTSIPGKVATEVGNIVAQFVGLAGKILRTVGDIVIRPRVVMPHIPGTGGGAVKHDPNVPDSESLDRSLSTDPAMRMTVGSADVSLAAGSGKVVSADNWTIVTPSLNPRIVATEVLNELVARAV